MFNEDELFNDDEIDEIEDMASSLSVFENVYSSIDDVILYANTIFNSLKDEISKRYTNKKMGREKMVMLLDKIASKSKRLGDETLIYLMNEFVDEIKEYFTLEDLTIAFLLEYGKILKEIVDRTGKLKKEVKKIELNLKNGELKVVDITELHKLINEIIISNPKLKELSSKVEELGESVDTLENLIKMKFE